MDAQEATTVIATLARRIQSRRADIALATSYLRGREGRLRFASDEFRDYFEKRFAGFSDNWCMPVTQAPVERMKHLGIRLNDPRGATDAELQATWQASDADRGLSEALTMMTAAKRAFGLVSPMPGAPARITFEHPDSSIVAYDAVTRQRRYGLTVWDGDKVQYAQFYTPTLTVGAQRPLGVERLDDRRVAPNLDGWVIDADSLKANPLGAVPLVEFRNQTLLDDDPFSDIEGVMAMQDSINLTWAYQLNGLDYASLPQRIVSGSESPKEPVLDDKGQVVGYRPLELDKLIRDRIAFLPAGATPSEWSAANLDAFAKVIEQAVEHIAAQTRTPPHYLIAKMVNTSGEALTVAEAGLVSKVIERTGYATPAVREIYRLVALAEGQAEKARQIQSATIVWSKPQYRSEAQLADAMLKWRQIGFPIQWVAEEYGMGPAEVQRLLEMIRQEQTDPFLEQAGQKVVTGGAPAADAEPSALGA